MTETVAIGIQSFDKLIEGNYFYIDKTSFIQEWWDSGDDVTLITRPRRFGKTLNISMVEQFFSVEYANRGDLFEKFSIWRNEKYHTIQGIYPVISLSFANIKENNFESTKLRIYQLLIDLYNKHEYLLDSGILTHNEKDFFVSVKMDMKEVEATLAIHKMTEFLSRYYGKKTIVLLDEYDTPMQEAYVHGFLHELAAFSRSLFNATFKTNPYMERGIMTGITRVSKESIFSDLNNLKVVTTTSDEYATSFGFTEEEVFEALKVCGMDREQKKVKRWYDGFIFGKHRDIYNPWSILNFLDTGEYTTYWANTSSNSLVGKLIQEGNEEIKQSFEALLKGKQIKCPIDEQIVYEQLNYDESAIWSLMLASGYLKVLDYEKGDEVVYGEEPLYQLALTNYEVEQMFRKIVRSWFMPAKTSYNYFIKAMFMGDLDAMNEYMNQIACELFSNFDTGKRVSEKAQPERFYHGFVLGLMVDLHSDYVITSNRESGFGRYDIMLEPREPEKNPAVIIEFKVMNVRREQTLEETAAAALKQIEEKHYDSVLLARGIQEEKILKYGFAFEGKKVLISKQ